MGNEQEWGNFDSEERRTFFSQIFVTPTSFRNPSEGPHTRQGRYERSQSVTEAFVRNGIIKTGVFVWFSCFPGPFSHSVSVVHQCYETHRIALATTRREREVELLSLVCHRKFAENR